MRIYLRAIILLASIAIVSLVLASCQPKVETIELNMGSEKEINTTMFVRNESNYVEEGLKELAPETEEGSCQPQVLLAKVDCRWSHINESNLDITIQNNGYSNVTMAFYFYDDEGKIGAVLNDTLFVSKARWVFTLPFAELSQKYGNIKNIHAAPAIDKDGVISVCSNKKLPILVESCG